MLKNFILKDNYNDSVVLMNAANIVRNKFSNKNVSAVMATPQNMELLSGLGLMTDEGREAGSADLIFAVKMEDGDEGAAESAEKMFETFQKVMTEKSVKKDTGVEEAGGYEKALTGDDALVLMSIPGTYVAREAERALSSGKNVMVFSDNVSLEVEIKLKNMAKDKGLLFMGPDCGTCILNGKGLGFANVVRKGSIGIIGASGSGLQEVTCSIHTLGCGITQAIGTGGRDMKSAVGGITSLSAMDYFENDKDTEVVLIVAKPPDADVADEIIEKAKKSKKKYVINFLTMELNDFGNIQFAANLEEAAVKACRLIKPFVDVPKVDVEIKPIKGKYLRGLYGGGTLCYEALYLMKDLEIFSNTPINKLRALRDPFKSFRNCMVDMGEDEFTRGYPHPMMDFTLRKSRIVEEARDTDVGALMLDCTLGYGCHPDPAAELAEAMMEAKKLNPELIFITTITGTADDYQDYAAQKKKLESTGAVVYPTNRQAIMACRKLLSAE